MKRGIILFIVEGHSDQDALAPYITKRLDKLKRGLSIEVMHGDILTEYIENTKSFKVNAQNIKGEIKKIIENHFKSQRVKAEQIQIKDVIEVIYITDTDYCYLKKDKVSLNKKECLNKLFNFNEIEIRKNKIIEFKVIYFSKNLEHILKGSERDFSSEEKKRISLEFGKKAYEEENFFIETFNNENLKIWETYELSYKNIKTCTKRACNMNNFLDELDSLEKIKTMEKNL